ncbi:MAG: FMN-binding protein, partial [Gammaproteobacteria bacterium]
PQAFLKETFGEVPKPRLLWITKDLKKGIRDILGHDLGVLRLRYWQEGKRTAWILEEIGKEEPITVGIVVNGGRIERIKVLAFRESRGWEVRYPFFTDQFKGAGLDKDKALDRPIDGISGATLSVRALKKLARLALFLHSQVAGD